MPIEDSRAVELLRLIDGQAAELGALREAVMGELSHSEQAAYRDGREVALQQMLLQNDHWSLHRQQAQARRIDGLIVCQSHRGDSTGWSWCLMLHTLMGGPPGRLWLAAQDLASGILEVDRRFPLAPWWPALDHAVYRPFMEPAPSGGSTPT